MRYTLIYCAFWLLLALVIVGASRPQILMEDDLRAITNVPMDRAIATGWKGWIIAYGRARLCVPTKQINGGWQ
jgi:hypothetical protein